MPAMRRTGGRCANTSVPYAQAPYSGELDLQADFVGVAVGAMADPHFAAPTVRCGKIPGTRGPHLITTSVGFRSNLDPLDTCRSPPVGRGQKGPVSCAAICKLSARTELR